MNINGERVDILKVKHCVDTKWNIGVMWHEHCVREVEQNDLKAVL